MADCDGRSPVVLQQKQPSRISLRRKIKFHMRPRIHRLIAVAKEARNHEVYYVRILTVLPPRFSNQFVSVKRASFIVCTKR